MVSSFSQDFPPWLIQPEVLNNVLGNQTASLKDVTTATNIQDSTLFMSGLRQALYWRRRLAPAASSHTVLFSFLGVRGLTLPNVLEVCKALKNICNMTKLVEVYRALNSPFIGISFNDSSQAILFQSLCVSYDSSFVIHVSASSLHQHFKLLGLPPLFPDNRIHHFLTKHFAQHQFTRDHIATDDNISTPTNSVFGTVLLSPLQDVTSLPHLIPLPAPHLGNALLIISGRQSLCLKCGGLGHIRRSCSSSKCTLCHHFHPSSATCPPQDPLINSSIFNPWMLPDSPSSSSSPDSITTYASECNHTCEESSIVALSSPSVHSQLTSCPIAKSSITVSTTPSDTSIMPLSSTIDMSQDPSTLPTRRITRSMASGKPSISISASSKSSISSQDHSNNIFSHLMDEASLLPEDSSNTASSHSSIPDKSSSSSFFTPSISLPQDLPVLHAPSLSAVPIAPTTSSHTAPSSASSTAFSDLSSTSCLSSLSPTHKKLKLSAASPSLPILEPLESLTSTIVSELSSKHIDASLISSNDVIESSYYSSHELIPPVPLSSWADQSEMELEEPVPLSTIQATLVSSSPSSSSSVSHSSRTHPYTLESLLPHPTATSAIAHFRCPSCHTQLSLNWPIDDVYVCTDCDADLSFKVDDFFIPVHSSHSIYLMLPSSYFNEPDNIAFLKFCLAQKVRLKTLRVRK